MRRLALSIFVSLGLHSPGWGASFDLVALRRLPEIDALETGCAPPLLAYAIPVPTEQLLAAAAAHPGNRRALAWLLFLRHTVPDRPPLDISIGEPAAPILEQVEAALRAAALGSRAALLAGAPRTKIAIAYVHMMEVHLPPPSATRPISRPQSSPSSTAIGIWQPASIGRRRR